LDQENAGGVSGVSSWAGLAQLVEQLICNQQVAGSSPIASFLFGPNCYLDFNYIFNNIKIGNKYTRGKDQE
jgi:hypothetical protein